MAARPNDLKPPIAAGRGEMVFLICGEDEFSVKQRARTIFEQWRVELGGTDHEIIDAVAGSANEAVKVLARLREALQTLPFFGTHKAVWLQNCTFLGDDRTASSSVVTENLSELSRDLKLFSWEKVRLLISGGKVDRRKTFFKTLEKVGKVEIFSAWSVDDRDWAEKAENFVLHRLEGENKKISDNALGRFVHLVGPHPRLLSNEVEKVTLFIGDRKEIEVEDVEAIVSKNKNARSFALADAVGDRNLSRALSCLDEEIWEMRTDSQRSEIGLLYGLISKIRSLIFLQELLKKRLIKPSNSYPSFKVQLENLPDASLPQDKKYNPKAINPYVLFKALSQVENYNQEELVNAMEILLDCNLKLVSRGIDETILLQHALIKLMASESQNAEDKGPKLPRQVTTS